jgi:MFS family permease
MPAASAYMADLTDASERTKGMGAVGAANNVGSIVGPAVAGLAVISLLTPLWVMAGVAVLNGLFVWRFLPEPPRHTAPAAGRGRMKYTDPRILPFVVLGVSMFTGMALVQQTMGFRFQDVLALDAAATARTVGIAMMLSAGCSLIAQGVVVQRLSLPPLTLLWLALPVLMVAFVLMAALNSRTGLSIAMMLQGFGMGLAGPAFMAGASLAVSAEEQGAVAGVAGSCGPLGFALGPMIGGALYQFLPELPYAFAAAMYFVLLVFMGRITASISQHRDQ